MLEKLNKLTNWQAVIIIAVLGFTVFFAGLTNPFQGDDLTQIVNNPVVHSIKNEKLFFEGSTFYNGHGVAPLSGAYYKPLMTTVYSLIYTFFGASPIYFHLFQLVLCIGSTILLYLLFRYSFKPILALVLAVIFLIHPIDSQVIYAIPSMQDALFFFFGILGIYLLVKFSRFMQSNKNYSLLILPIVALCMFLSLLSKETGLLFVAITLIYLFMFDEKKRLYTYLAIVCVPLLVWFALRLNALGLGSNPHNAPIDNISLIGRLFTIPSIIQFYITKTIFPYKLASNYFWVYPHFSISHTLIPLLIDLFVVGLFIYLSTIVRRRATKADYYTYFFFCLWVVLGLIAHLQIIPLDGTASEPWFYFSMAGLLGMAGVLLKLYDFKSHLNWSLCLIIIVIGILGVRTFTRGMDWSSPYILAQKDVSVSKQDYIADEVVADNLLSQDRFIEAQAFANQSISIFPTATNYESLGLALMGSGNYADAITAFNNSLKFGSIYSVYIDIEGLTLVYGDPSYDRQFLINTLAKYPKDSTVWFYYALYEDNIGNDAEAKTAIINAASLGPIPQGIYNNILDNQSFTITISNINKTVTI